MSLILASIANKIVVSGTIYVYTGYNDSPIFKVSIRGDDVSSRSYHHSGESPFLTSAFLFALSGINEKIKTSKGKQTNMLCPVITEMRCLLESLSATDHHPCDCALESLLESLGKFISIGGNKHKVSRQPIQFILGYWIGKDKNKSLSDQAKVLAFGIKSGSSPSIKVIRGKTMGAVLFRAFREFVEYLCERKGYQGKMEIKNLFPDAVILPGMLKYAPHLSEGSSHV